MVDKEEKYLVEDKPKHLGRHKRVKEFLEKLEKLPNDKALTIFCTDKKLAETEAVKIYYRLRVNNLGDKYSVVIRPDGAIGFKVMVVHKLPDYLKA
jgi:hypothetical protein